MKYMTKLEEILKILRKNREILRKKFGVKKIEVFGSYVNGEETEKSDIDLLIEFEKGKKTFDNFMELVFFLEKILGKKVDLLTKNGISPYIRPYVKTVVVFEKV